MSETKTELLHRLANLLALTAQQGGTIRKLQNAVDVVNNQKDVESRRVSDLTRQVSDLTGALNLAKAHMGEVFQRHHVEAMSRTQLISFIEQGINEARRKGLVEAEGLVSRHKSLERETDIEMMQGVVRIYQARIDELSAERAAGVVKAKGDVKLDTRPLKDKLTPVGAKNSTTWWSKPLPTTYPGDFAYFDERATEITKQAKSFGTLADHEKRYIAGDTGNTYVLAREGDVYSCECEWWKHRPDPVDRRTCKHLKRLLGEEAELARVHRPQPSCWCGVILVRGQCQVHTTNWHGDEKCNCGRAFWFCNDEYRSGRAPTKLWHVPRLAGTPEPVKNPASLRW